MILTPIADPRERAARQRMRRRAGYYLAAMNRLRSEVLEIEGARIRTCPNVFNPRASSSTRHICAWVRERSPLDSFLDMGTGTGAIGIVAALNGCTDVWMTDCNADAAECARANVRANGVGDHCMVEGCTGTSSIKRRFHMIVFAAPYLWFGASSILRRQFGALVDSMFDEDDTSKTALIDDARRVLEPGGSLVLQLGSISRLDAIMERAREAGLVLVEVSRAPDGREEHLILEFKHAETR